MLRNFMNFIYNGYIVTDGRDGPFIRLGRTRFLIISCYLKSGVANELKLFCSVPVAHRFS